jgi:rRNA biogenesis protein RRP5
LCGWQRCCAQRVPAGLATLAVVKKVDASHVYLNLPYGLTAVSKSADVNPAAALLASGHVAESASDSDSDSELPTETTLRGMQKLFSAGQYVSCVVLRNESEGKGKAGGQKSILHVSLHPAVVNSELTFDHLSKKNPTVWGAITSKEDHGFVVDVGVAGVHAFLPFSNVVGGPSSLLPGSCGFFSVSAQKKGASSVVLAYDPSQAGKVTKSDGVLSLASLKPGMLVDATVKKVTVLYSVVVEGGSGG